MVVRDFLTNISEEEYTVKHLQPIKQTNGFDCGMIFIDVSRQLAIKVKHIKPTLTRRDMKK